MKKYFFRLFLFILIIFNIIIISNYYKKIFSNDQIIIKSKSEEIINNELLSYLYETQIDSGIYQTVSDSNWDLTNYRFNSKLSKCQNGSKLSYNEITKQVTLQGNKADKCYLYFDQVSLIKFSDYIKSLYTSDGTNGMYLHDGVGTYTNADLEAGDNSYRFSGTNPRNYVCFGSNEEVCAVENLYRIIGVFNNDGEDQIKLIKYDYATENMLGTETYGTKSTKDDYFNTYRGFLLEIPRHSWSKRGTYSNNSWKDNLLYSETLNYNFLNFFDKINTNWNKMIALHNWSIGGLDMNYATHSNAKKSYDYELGEYKTTGAYVSDCDGNGPGTETCTYDSIVEAKIGLMYTSEYYYSSDPAYWSFPVFTYETNPDVNGNYGPQYDYRAATDSNWMYMGSVEWTMSKPNSPTTATGAFFIFQTGYVNTFAGVTAYCAIRPTFYLDNSVVYISGNGTIIEPFRVSI